jgi:hypothetical protein
MKKHKTKQLPTFNSLDDLVKFFDDHDMGEYSDKIHKVEFEVNIKKHTHLIAINADIANKLTDIARSQHISSAHLVNSWLKEKIRRAA